MQIVSLTSSFDKSVLNKFLKKHLTPEASFLFRLASTYSNDDSIILLDQGKIVGIGCVLHVAPKQAAIGCVRISNSSQFENTYSTLLESLVQRAKLAHNYTSVISKNSSESSLLSRLGFTKSRPRDDFHLNVQKYSNEQGTVVTDLYSARSELEKVKPDCISLHFRRVFLNDESLDYALQKGAVLISENDPSTGIALAFESKCFKNQSNSVQFIPSYLETKANEDDLDRIGEVNILSADRSLKIFSCAKSWLGSKGLQRALFYIYDPNISGFDLMKIGLEPLRSQQTWQKELTGPLDGFL